MVGVQVTKDALCRLSQAVLWHSVPLVAGTGLDPARIGRHCFQMATGLISCDMFASGAVARAALVASVRGKLCLLTGNQQRTVTEEVRVRKRQKITGDPGKQHTAQACESPLPSHPFPT